MAITFRFANRDEYARLSRFLHEYWAKDHAYCRMPELFEWTFRRSTHWPEDQYSFALAEDNGELAGILGGIPFTFNAFGKESRSVWIVNYVISPEHRKGHAGVATVKPISPSGVRSRGCFWDHAGKHGDL